MAYPDPPQKQTSYTAFAQSQGDGSFPGPQVDVDLNDLIRSVEDLLVFIRTVIRSDGRLGNGIVRRENLGADIALGFNAPTTWAAGTDYGVSDTVFVGSNFYIALQAHTASETFSTDLDSGRWSLLVDLSPTGALLSQQNLSDLDDAKTARDNLGLGPVATQTVVGLANGGTAATDAATARSNLGLGSAATGNIGTQVQAYSATLSAIAALTTTAYGRGFLALADAAAGRTRLELGGLATESILDEDSFASNSATRPPSQQSTKAYVDGRVPGVGQQWTGQTSSRTANTAYQNTTGRPIEVSISLTNDSVAVQVSIDATSWLTLGTGAGNSGELANISFTVPPGHYYRTNGPFDRWMELR